MILPQLLSVQVLLLDLRIDAGNIVINLPLLRLQLLQLATHVHYLPLDLRILIATHPLDRILLQFLDIVNPLEDVRDIVDATLLDSEQLDGLVEIDGAILAALDKLDELLGED